MLEERLQGIVNSFSEGAAAHLLRALCLVLAGLALFGLYSWTQFRGLVTPESMEHAQLARQVAEIDVVRLREAVEGDVDLARELLTLYLSDIEKRLPSLEKGLREEDASMVHQEVHTIKGASANLGVEGMRKLAVRLEQECKEGAFHEGLQLMAELRAELDRVRELANEIAF